MDTINERGSYDPDEFDWDGDSTPPVDEVEFNMVEVALETVTKLCERQFGWVWRRPSKQGEVAKKVFKVKVVMPVEHRAWFEAEWPEYLFEWEGASVHHDHPRSHLCTELNEIEMWQRCVEAGTPAVDLFGNPGRAAKYARKCLTLYSRKTPRDYLRYQHAAKFTNAKELDWEALIRGDYRVDGKRVHDVFLTHALYYLSLDKVGEFVNAHPLNRVSALVHRHPFTSGTLNAGELEYEVDEEGNVTQKNALTGEKYVHPSMEALFHQFNCKVSTGGLCWTTRKVGGDTFLFEFVGCPGKVCGDYVPFKYLKPETRTEETFCNVTVRKFLHFTWSYVERQGQVIHLSDSDLLTKLRRYQAGRLRGPRQKTELMNYARRLTNKEDIIAIHGGGAHEIAVGSMADYVEAAFYMDVRQELQCALAHFKENAAMVMALNNYYEKGALPKDFTIPVRVVQLVSAGAAAVRALPSLREELTVGVEFERPGVDPVPWEEPIIAGGW
jgi:hypothetical protein